jgi:hypothetical protein
MPTLKGSSLIELQMCPAPSALELEDLLCRGNMEQLTSNTGPVAQAFKKAHDMPIVGDLPVVPALLSPTDPAYLDPYVLSLLLRQKPPPIEDIQVFPPVPTPQTAGEIMSDLVEHLKDMEYCDTSSTVSFMPRTVDQFVPPLNPDDDVPDSLFHGDRGLMSIMPCRAMLPLECSMLQSYSEVHLVCGVRVYIIWPPTRANMAKFDSYLRCSDEERAAGRLTVCETLESGITFIQRPGQILYLPSFCPAVVFSTKTSASIMLETRMIEGVAWQFCYVDLLLRQKFILAPHDILGLTAELMVLLLRMHEDLEMVLCMDPLEIPDFDLHVANLGAIWNHSGLCFREFIELVFVLCAEKKTQVLTNVPKHWATVVEALQLKRCPICQADIIAPDFSFIEHFSSLHWNTDASRTHLRLVAISAAVPFQ